MTGTILGTVLDESGAAVPAAAVTVNNTLTGEIRRASSDAAGAYIYHGAASGPIPGGDPA